MDGKVLVILACTIMATSAWSIPYYPVSRVPLRVTRYAPAPPHFYRPQIHAPVNPDRPEVDDEQWERPKRDHHDYDHDYDHGHGHDDHGHGHKGTHGVTGPVHTFVKTDKNANYKWGVRHHVGNKYAS